MHELGIVFHIIKTVEQVGEQNRLNAVSAVTLELGEVSGVVPHELTDCWRWAAAKTDLMKEAALRIETIPARTLCEACGHTYPTVPHGRTCPRCASEQTHLAQGNEVVVKEIEAC